MTYVAIEEDPVAAVKAPVSPKVSKAALLASKPINTRPVPKAVHVPKPNNVPGLVATVALVYTDPTGYRASRATLTKAVVASWVVSVLAAAVGAVGTL